MLFLPFLFYKLIRNSMNTFHLKFSSSSQSDFPGSNVLLSITDYPGENARHYEIV